MAGSSARLTILNGPMVGKELALEEVVDNILIGSDGACRFHLPMPGISPIHARIWMDASGVTVYDTHSPRGLYVNDDRVNGQAPLRNGDVLWLGTPGEEEAVMIQVRLPPRSGATAAAPAAGATEADRTVAMIPPAVSEPEALEVVDEGATVSMPAPGLDAFMIAEPAPEELEAAADFESDATIVDYSTPSPAPAEETLLQEESVLPAPTEEPVKFAIDLPPAPPEPPPFEDETTEMAAPEPAYAPPPPPPVVEPPPPPRPPAPVVAPPPPVVTPPAPPRAARTAAHAAPPPRLPAGSSAGKLAAAGVVGLVVVAGGGYAAWRMLQAPEAPTAPFPVPASTAAAATTSAPIEAAPVIEPPQEVAPAPLEPVPEPPVEEAVTIVKIPPPTTAAAGPRPVSLSPTAKATAAPPPTTVSPSVAQAQQTAALAAGHVSRGDALATGRDYAGAAAAYDEALKLDSGNARATEGKALALAAVASLKKTFVAGRTSVQSSKAAKGGLSGFDSEDVSVAKAPDYSGRIDFEASPRNVKAGDSYTILAYLTNDGKKGFKIQGVTVSTVANGARSAAPVSLRDRDLEPQQRVLLAELPGTWQADTKTWSVEVSVTSNRNDTFKNSLIWK